MLWRKQGRQGVSGLTEQIVPVELTLPFSAEIVQSKFNALQDQMAERGGLPHFVEALQKKQQLFSSLLEREKLSELDSEKLDALLELVFTARRRIPNLMQDVALDQVQQRIDGLLFGEGDINHRIGRFAGCWSDADGKQQRALWDFAAEILHFRDPERYPLMSRWVWDENTLSGAVRELIRGTDTLREIPLTNDAGVFQAVREWIGGVLTEYGLYRDLHFIVDLVLARAYADYSTAISSHMGMMQAEFGAKNDPLEMVVKLLGIDPAKKDGRSRLKRA